MQMILNQGTCGHSRDCTRARAAGGDDDAGVAQHPLKPLRLVVWAALPQPAALQYTAEFLKGHARLKIIGDRHSWLPFRHPTAYYLCVLMRAPVRVSAAERSSMTSRRACRCIMSMMPSQGGNDCRDADLRQGGRLLWMTLTAEHSDVLEGLLWGSPSLLPLLSRKECSTPAHQDWRL